MRSITTRLSLLLLTLLTTIACVHAADTVEDYILEYPNQEQTRMMNAWLAKGNQPGILQVLRSGKPQ